MNGYEVKYKRKNQWFWRRIKNVEGDLLAADLPGYRVFFLMDKGRIELPLDGTAFIFSKDRFFYIKRKMEQEAGQPIVTR